MSEQTHSNSAWPPPLMTSEPGTFAQHTILERKPKIIQQVIRDNDYGLGVLRALEAFRDEIASQPMRPLGELASDIVFWNRELAAHRGKTWLEVPWYFAETYFYRRLLEASGFFQPGPWEGRDPFEKQKRKQIKAAVSQLAKGWAELQSVEQDTAFEALLHSCLWGNRADLSNYTVRLQAQGGLLAQEERRNIVIDHTDSVRELLTEGVDRVDFVNDNVGMDVLFDLALADLMLVQGQAQAIVFHLKDRPFFVSDAMPKDVQLTLALLQVSANPAVQALGVRLQDHLVEKRLVLEEDSFWTTCLMFRQFPSLVRAKLARSDLVILKGDVNYRRLLSDRHWAYTTSMREITAYFPAPYLVLRTLKGEIIVGLEPGQAEALAAQDRTWLINGKRGIIQLVMK